MKDPALVQQPETLRVLDKFLRGELAAAATYEKALEHIASEELRAVLRENHASHSARASTIAQQIRNRGGEPSQDAGPWGVFTKIVEAGAAAVGDEAIVKVLEEGETHGVHTYELDAPRLADEAAVELSQRIIAEQKRTAARMQHLEA